VRNPSETLQAVAAAIVKVAFLYILTAHFGNFFKLIQGVILDNT
jgi:hypothetical protein